jgi:hypothetical protein
MELEKPQEAKNTEKVEAVHKQIRIERVNLDNIRPVFSNDFMINRASNEYYLTFSVVEPPQIFSSDDLDAIEKVSAIAVSKIVITPEFAKELLDVLQRNLNIDEESRENDSTEN